MLEQFEKYFLVGDTPEARMARSTGLVKPTLDAYPAMMSMGGNAFAAMTRDAAVGGGMAFLQSELEKLDPKVREPLTSVTWMRDVPIKTGGGWVNFTSVFNVDYAISGPNMYGLMGTNTNTIPVMQANIGKDIYRVYNWGNVLKVSFIDMQLMQQAGRSLEDLLDKGIKLNWNKTLDLVVYNGPIGAAPDTGLVNNTTVTQTSVALGAEAGTPTAWNLKTPGEILYDVNAAMVATWAASQYDVTGMANHILIPPAQYAYITSQLVSIAGTVSILEFLLKNNIGKSQGVDLKIFPSRWCIGAGTGGKDLMVAYVNDPDRLYMDITVPINRVMTMPTVMEGGAYLTLYLGQIGIVKFLYYQPVMYAYGI
jgi:hypothetical protein